MAEQSKYEYHSSEKKFSLGSWSQLQVLLLFWCTVNSTIIG